MKTYHKIVIGDSRRMASISDESLHLIVTSPPYWQLKDYGTGGQIGFDDTYEEYINNLNLVWKECHRTLHKGCRLCINTRRPVCTFCILRQVQNYSDKDGDNQILRNNWL